MKELLLISVKDSRTLAAFAAKFPKPANVAHIAHMYLQDVPVVLVVMALNGSLNFTSSNLVSSMTWLYNHLTPSNVQPLYRSS